MGTPATKDDVLNWLLKQGYPLELEVEQQFREVGAATIPSPYFVDPGSGKARESDLIARFFQTPPDSESAVLLSICVECKHSEQPWIGFTHGDEARQEFYPLDAITTPFGRQAFGTAMWHRPGGRALPLFTSTAPLATGVTTVKENPKDRDVAYHAAVSVGQAACYEALQWSSQHDVAVLVFPLLVVDGPLFMCEIDKTTNSIAVNDVSYLRLNWRNPQVSDYPIAVDIVNKAGLRNVLLAAPAAATALAQRVVKRLAFDKRLGVD